MQREEEVSAQLAQGGLHLIHTAGQLLHAVGVGDADALGSLEGGAGGHGDAGLLQQIAGHVVAVLQHLAVGGLLAMAFRRPKW